MNGHSGRPTDPVYERPAFDWLWAATLVAAHYAVVWITGQGDIMAWHGPERRSTIYVTLAGSTGTLLAVVSVGLGIYLSASGERMRWLRRHASWRGTRVWLAVVVNLLVTLVVAIAALATDSSVDAAGEVVKGAEWMRWLVQLAVLSLAISFTRMLLFFRAVLTTKGLDEDDEGKAGSPQRGVGFGER